MPSVLREPTYTYADTYTPPTYRFDLGGSVDFGSTDFYLKLIRLRKGKMTYINAWSSVDSYEAVCEDNARVNDQEGDTYLVFNLKTGQVIRQFYFNVELVPQRTVAEV